MKRKTIVIAAAGVVLCIVAVTGIVKAVSGGGKAVDVTQVSYLNNNWWESTTTSGGYITANASQQVYLSSDGIVEKVYVKAGDKVKIGDVLLDYDKTLLELDLEEEELNAQILELELEGAKNDLEKLKGTTPVADSAGYGSYDDTWDDDEYLDDGGDDDDDDYISDELDRAAVVPNSMVLVAASTEGNPTVDVPQTEGKTPSDTPETAAPPAETETQGGAVQPESEPSAIVQPPTEAETETVEESPLAKTKAYKKLNYKTKYYKGSGTKADPYIYLCKDGAEIEASFMNMILGFNEDASSRKQGGVNKDGKGCYAVLEIREGDSLAGGFLRSVSINGTIKTDKPYAPDVTWSFTSLGVTKNEPDIPDREEEDDFDDEFWEDDEGFWDYGDDVYTASELKDAIAAKEKEIKEMELDIKEAEISIRQAGRKVDAATIKATINGVVKEVGDPKLGQIDGEAFMLITSNQGMYVKGTISEMDLEKIEKGSLVSGMTQESGMMITAEITEISEYPSESGGGYYYGEGNPNASSYPFTAYIENSEDLINNEWVDLQIESTKDSSTSVYLAKALIRSENGQSYVYKKGENDKLVKQYVRTGQTLYSTYIEVKEGLTEEDWIAFPYGKNVKEGAAVNELEGSGFADDMYY